jgi:hypothetical protein
MERCHCLAVRDSNALHPLPPSHELIGGLAGLSGAAAWLLSFPLDTVKTAVQGRPLDAPRVAAMDAARNILLRRGGLLGLLGLYSGAVPSVMRAFIVSGTRFSTYEVVVGWCRSGVAGPAKAVRSSQ